MPNIKLADKVTYNPKKTTEKNGIESVALWNKVIRMPWDEVRERCKKGKRINEFSVEYEYENKLYRLEIKRTYKGSKQNQDCQVLKSTKYKLKKL